MVYSKAISVIIPHRNSPELLGKLLSTIPETNDIEVIVVDNSPIPIERKDIRTDRDYCLLYSDVSRGAGGARNVGIEHSSGVWLMFADADDYFAPNAFDVVLEHLDASSDIVYFSVDGVYLDSGEHADRADHYAHCIKKYISGELNDDDLKYSWFVPWGKMVKHDLVNRYAIRYDEIVASNDIYFSVVSGYYANSIDVDPRLMYIVTVNRGSLTRRRDLNVIESRLYASLHTNLFLKEKRLYSFQVPVIKYLYQSKEFGLKTTIRFLKEIIKCKQNPFVGFRKGLMKFRRYKELERKESQYIVK